MSRLTPLDPLVPFYGKFPLHAGQTKSPVWRTDWSSLCGLPEGTAIETLGRTGHASRWVAYHNPPKCQDWKFLLTDGRFRFIIKTHWKLRRHYKGFRILKP